MKPVPVGREFFRPQIVFRCGERLKVARNRADRVVDLGKRGDVVALAGGLLPDCGKNRSLALARHFVVVPHCRLVLSDLAGKHRLALNAGPPR